jgi:hypothetical protein
VWYNKGVNKEEKETWIISLSVPLFVAVDATSLASSLKFTLATTVGLVSLSFSLMMVASSPAALILLKLRFLASQFDFA